MNKYVIILNGKMPEKLSEELLHAHVLYLKELSNQGRLVLCGPFKDNQSAIQVITAKDASEAESLVQKDPFITKEYYASHDVRELIEANEENNWLMGHDQTSTNLSSSNT